MPACHRIHHRTTVAFTRLREERGQAVVEFAVVLPVLMLIVLGIIYFGRYESYSTQMTQLAEQGARQAAVGFVASSTNGSSCTGTGASGASISCWVQNQATGELAQGSSDVGRVGVYVDCDPSNASDTSCSSGDNVQVCVATPVQIPFTNMRAATIYQSATMRIESPASPQIQNSSTGGNAPSC